MKRFGIIFLLLAVVSVVAMAGMDKVPFAKLSVLNTNGVAKSDTISGLYGTVEAIEIYASAGGGLLTGNVAVVVMRTNAAMNAVSHEILYTNAALTATHTMIYPVVPVHSIGNGTITNAGTVNAKVILVNDQIVFKAYSANALATGTNYSMSAVLYKTDK